MFPKFKKKEDIPAQFVELYHEVDGEWVYKAPEPEDDANPVKLKGALDKERERADKAEKEVKAAAKKIKDLERDAEGKSTTKEVREQIRKEVEEELKAEFEPTTKERDTLKAENRGLKLDGQVQDLALKNGVRPEKIKQWWKLHSDRFDLAEDGSTPVVKNKVGADLGKFIANDLKKDVPEFYKGTEATGGGAGGAGGAGGGGATGTQLTAEQIMANPAEALRIGREQGRTQ